MIYDYRTYLINKNKASIKQKIEEFSGKQSEWKSWIEKKLTPILWTQKKDNWYDNFTLLSLLSSFWGDKDSKKETIKAIKTVYRYKLGHKTGYEVPPESWNWIESLADVPPKNINDFPKGSWLIHFTFRLEKPYLSRDDTDFYIIDNPVKKEWVFKVPYVASSQWKGALRAAMMQELVFGLQDNGNEGEFLDKRVQLWRIFGNERDGAETFLNMALARYRSGEEPQDEKQYKEWRKCLDDEARKVGEHFFNILNEKKLRKENIEGFRGSLFFYPTYFNMIGLEVINPHSRKTGSGTQPIYFECVPEKTNGEFCVLYVPFVYATAEDCLDDLKAVVYGIISMMTTYGFGAKTSSGFGVTVFPFQKVFVKASGDEMQEVASAMVDLLSGDGS